MGCPPPQPTRRYGGAHDGLGERPELPQQGPGQSRAPAEKRVLEYLDVEKTNLISLPLTFP